MNPEAEDHLLPCMCLADYIEDLIMADGSHGSPVHCSEAMAGKNIMESPTCKPCHKEDETSIGPAYTGSGQEIRS